MTPEEERWAEAVAIERIHGERAVAWVAGRIDDLAAADDQAGVNRFTEIASRLARLRERGMPQ